MFSVLYFPIWWYTVGLKKRLHDFRDNIRNLSRYLAIKILLTNILKPMFGQYNWQGRIISLVIRILQLIVFLVVFVLGFFIFLLLLILWLVIIPLAIIQIIKFIRLF